MTTPKPLEGKHIILGITGGIAAYKSAMLLRLMVKAGAEVQVVMTPAAREFITPVTLSALSGKPVVSEFFTANTGEWHSHVDLGLWADLMVVAPATACTLAKMATGVADNMLVTTYLSARCPVMVAPAMDLDMMAHPTTTANLATLAAHGVTIVEPACGELASGLSGRGRMAEPEEIVRAVEARLAPAATMAGRHLLITSGPTRERIDPVRYISNYSTGRMGTALAEEAARRGARVTFITGPAQVTPAPHPAITMVSVESARQMLDAALEAWPHCTDALLCAAVADYAPAAPATSKIKRELTGELTLALTPNPDIAAALSAARHSGQRLCGFALETDHEADNALTKLRRKGLDMIVLNSMRHPGAGPGGPNNRVTIYTAVGSVAPYPLMPKPQVAEKILDTLCNL